MLCPYTRRFKSKCPNANLGENPSWLISRPDLALVDGLKPKL